MAPEKQRENDPTTGESTLGKAVRRNLSPRRVASLLARGFATLKNRGFEALGREISFRYRLATGGEVWRHWADIPLRKELRAQKKAQFPRMPLISVVVPLYKTPKPFLDDMVRSVLAQSYQDFELVLVDGSGAAHGETAKNAALWQAKDSRVHLHRMYKNKGIAGNTNIGLAECAGEYILLLDHDDALSPSALYEVVRAVNDTGAELVYSDEAVMDESLKKLHQFHFKPDYSPDTLRGCNYITHICAFSKDLLARAGGGERPAFDGAQDYDLILRLAEQANRVAHIPKVLYFWRQHAESTASDISVKPKAIEAGRNAIVDHLNRVGLDGVAEPQPKFPGSYRVYYQIAGNPSISVVIPNMDHTEDLARCLESLYARASWRNFEVLVVENNSRLPETEAFYEKAARQYPCLRLVRYEGPFNFSAICNLGAQNARGEHLLLLNNDIEVLGNNFLYELLGYSQRPDVGAVGPLLYYPDDKIQHAGLFIGIAGSAGVNHKGHLRGEGGNMFRLCTAQNVSAVTGAALMVKRALYAKAGGLDEVNFAVAFNDVDFCLRLREMGYLNVFTPFAEAYHYESKSRGLDIEGEAAARFEAERQALREKYALLLQMGDPYYNPHLTLQHENYGYQ